jgi:hypothetical protein
MLAMIAAMVFLSVGCSSEFGIEEQLYQCATDEDCGDGLDCYTGLCADKDEFESLCRGYCSDFFDTCVSLVTDRQLSFDAFDECMGVCQAYPINGTEGNDDVNNLQCRLLHMERAKRSAGPGETLLHCGHSSPSGANRCGDTTKECLFFCHDLMDRCTGENRQFDTQQRCLQACKGYQDDGSFDCRRNAVPEPNQKLEVEFDCANSAAESPRCEES